MHNQSLPKKSRIYLLAPIVRGQKGEYRKEMMNARKQGFQRIKVDGEMLAIKALSIMNTKKITSLCVHSKKNSKKTIGILHIHSILQTNIH